MRFIIAALGRMKESPEKQLFLEYSKRLRGSLLLRELEEKRSLTGTEKTLAEAHLLRAQRTPHSRCVVLDERGLALSSEKFAKKIGAWQIDSVPDIVFMIGGADGLDPSIREEADLILSFGCLTWPHMLVRAMLAEQLYRVHTILTNHPYHRGG